MLKYLAMYAPIWIVLAVVLLVLAGWGIKTWYDAHERKQERIHELRLKQLDWDAHMAPYGHRYSQEELLVMFNRATELLKRVVDFADEEPTVEISMGNDYKQIRQLLNKLEHDKLGLPVDEDDEEVQQYPRTQQRGQ